MSTASNRPGPSQWPLAVAGLRSVAQGSSTPRKLPLASDQSSQVYPAPVWARRESKLQPPVHTKGCSVQRGAGRSDSLGHGLFSDKADMLPSVIGSNSPHGLFTIFSEKVSAGRVLDFKGNRTKDRTESQNLTNSWVGIVDHSQKTHHTKYS